MLDLKALEAETAALEDAASGAALTEEEKAAVAILERRQKALETKAAEDKARRMIDMATRERAAKSRVAAGVLVKAVDLVALFEVGYVPAAELLPGGGVVVVRSPVPARMDQFYADLEHKKRTLPAIYGDLLCEHVIDPDTAKDLGAAATLRAFCDNYQPAAIAAGDEVAKLGGSKLKADKRGRA